MNSKRQNGKMNADPAASSVETRRLAIQGAAFDVFRRYGFRRTSMEDIARAAGLSRAALYLHYRNKQDIFRSLVEAYFTTTEHRVQSALAPGLLASEALSAVFAAKAGPELEALLDSPHGEELLDANFSVCADIVQAGEERIAAMLADWLRIEAEAGRVSLDAADRDTSELAQTIINALAGQKTVAGGFAGYRAASQMLAALFGRALTP